VNTTHIEFTVVFKLTIGSSLLAVNGTIYLSLVDIRPPATQTEKRFYPHNNYTIIAHYVARTDII